MFKNMQKPSTIIALLLSFNLLSACRKQAPETNEAATLTVVNTIVEGQPLKLNTNNQVINNNVSANVGLLPGENNIYAFPINDSLHPYYTSSKFGVQGGDIYTLFLCGSVTNPEGILLKESIARYSDSIMGVRFINLSPGSPAVNLVLSTSPSILEFTNIQYKQATEFRTYPTTKIKNTYTFQVKRADNGALISSITLTGTSLATGLPRFKTITIVLRGLVGGTPSAGITRVNHY